MGFITEAPKQVPVIYEADICVVGGSCTGVFAAVRAARLGAKVVIVEQQNSFGGVATNGLVSVWHSFKDTERKKQIVSGLSEEVLDRLPQFDSMVSFSDSHFFNPVELKCELDAIVKEANIKVYFHTFYSGIVSDGEKIEAIFVDNKDGRGAIKAKFFIDATGDGDLCRDLQIERFENEFRQPPSYVFLMQGSDEASSLQWFNKDGSDIVSHMLNAFSDEFEVEKDWGWSTFVPGVKGAKMRANTHVFGVNCGKADDLTFAEMNGREKMRKVVRMMRKYGDHDQNYTALSDCSYVGVRDSYHYKTGWQADGMSLLLGEHYDDCIMRGTYNVDMHHSDDGITFMYFDGTYRTEDTDGNITTGNWWKERGLPLDRKVPTFYELPFRCLVGEKYTNLIAAGRMINADEVAFGALRVMINLNQIGEAAGVGAYLAVNGGKKIQDVDGAEVARTLAKGGSANLD